MVTTTTVYDIAETGAWSGGNVTDDGGATVSARGVCWSTSSNPTIADDHTTDGNGTGSFSSEITGLDPETTYYLRAYATNSEGTSYGGEEEFTTLAMVNTVTDYDGNDYQVVKIGFQTWMAENLKVTHYADGTPIPFVNDQTSWGNLGPEEKAYGFYDDNDTYGETYGALYTWAGAMNGAPSSYLNPSGVQGVCPEGWHLPSDGEWKQMEMYLGMARSAADSTRWRSTDLGGKLKEAGTMHWKSPNTGATNETGFTALPGGSRNTTGWSLNLTIDCYFWSSTDGASIDYGVPQVWYRKLGYERPEIYRNNFHYDAEGYSVRCVSDEVAATTPAVTTASLSSVTETSALSGGEVISDGGANVTARGICWSTTENPVLSDSHTTEGAGTGTFESSMTGLQCNTTYFVRAYATSSVGTAYGNQLYFTTDPCPIEKPSVTTNNIQNVTGVSAQIEGEVTDEGGAPVTTRGICWSTSSAPTLSDSFTIEGSGPGTFISDITGLSIGTNYYARAYATNAGGTTYGNERMFYTPDLPSVSTLQITNITDVSAQGGGNVTETGGAAVIERGICWSTLANPSLSDNVIPGGTGTGSYTSSITGLSPNVTYHVRAYATNVAGTQYGPDVSFTTWSGTVTDYDNNVYWTVDIGNQTWMAENLKVIHYPDGTLLTFVNDSATWDAIFTNDIAYCWYEDNSANGEIYGALYTWAAAMNGAGTSDANPSGVQGVCPDGWHIPSDSEWKELEMYLGMSQAEADSENVRGTNEGGKLKETGTIHWDSPNSGATNTSGFTALPGGFRASNGAFGGIGIYASFWSSTENQAWTAWRRFLNYSDSKVIRNYYNMDYGFSVRCVKD
jgi:uncharacterized protein (TIGR02145 family)